MINQLQWPPRWDLNYTHSADFWDIVCSLWPWKDCRKYQTSCTCIFKEDNVRMVKSKPQSKMVGTANRHDIFNELHPHISLESTFLASLDDEIIV